MVSETLRANALNKYFATPVRKIIGTKTTTITKVDANTGMATSLAASNAAVMGFFPHFQVPVGIFQDDNGIINE